MPPHPRIRSDQTVANFGASHKRHVILGRSFGHFVHPPSACLPTSHNGIPSSQPLDAGSLWATTAGSATFPSVQKDLRATGPSATMETGMRYQADIDALRRQQRRQLLPSGSPPGPTSRQWRLSAAHQMRPPCGSAVDRYYETVAFRMRP